MLLIDKINEKLNKLNFNLELESAVYKTKERTLSFVFSYEDSLMLTTQIKDLVNDVISNEFGKGIEINIRYKKNYFDEAIVGSFILEKLRKEYPMVGIDPNKIILERDHENKVKLEIDSQYQDFIANQPIAEFLSESLFAEYKSKFIVDIVFAENVAPQMKQSNDKFDYFNMSSSDEYEIELEAIEPYIGELIDTVIYPIATFVHPKEGIAVCGRIENLVEKQTKPKVDEKGKEKPAKEYFSFDLVDYSGSMKVVYFPGKANSPKFKKLTNGSEIAIFGTLEEDKFSAGLSLRPKVLNLCVTKKGFYDQIYSLPVPKTYKKVFPEPYVDTKQENLFIETKEISNEYLLANDFVVFDLETTGVNYQTDKIIEIGAVKIVQGKLVETFGTLVNPECHIPADATKVNNISDDDVKDAPTLKEVMPDFFKFCDGCVIVSYVIGFDFGFIEYHGKSLGYAFTQTTDDAFVLAKNKLKGLKNYKLVTVAKHLGVSLENAHRAVHDAVATAECMVKLLEEY